MTERLLTTTQRPLYRPDSRQQHAPCIRKVVYERQMDACLEILVNHYPAPSTGASLSCPCPASEPKLRDKPVFFFFHEGDSLVYRPVHCYS